MKEKRAIEMAELPPIRAILMAKFEARFMFICQEMQPDIKQGEPKVTEAIHKFILETVYTLHECNPNLTGFI